MNTATELIGVKLYNRLDSYTDTVRGYSKELNCVTEFYNLKDQHVVPHTYFTVVHIYPNGLRNTFKYWVLEQAIDAYTVVFAKMSCSAHRHKEYHKKVG